MTKSKTKNNQIINQKFNYWKVLEILKGSKVRVLCLGCNKIERILDRYRVERGKSKSCGCKANEFRKQKSLVKYGVDNISKASSIKNLKKESYLKKYGVENVSQSEEIKQQKIQTLQKNYGVDNPLKSEKVKLKQKRTIKELYGVSNSFQTPLSRLKAKITNLKKFGVENPFYSKEFQQVLKKQFNIKKYGIEHPQKLEKIKQKQKQTMLERYGVENGAHHPDIIKKMMQNNKKAFIIRHWKTNEEIICIGSYEAKTVEYFNKNKINFEWQSKTFTLEALKTTYRPDCYLPNINRWIEIKGYHYPISMEKYYEFAKFYPAELWDKDKLKELGIL